MSARDEAVEMIRRICPPHLSADEYGQILAEKFDAHRIENFNEAIQALHPWGLTMGEPYATGVNFAIGVLMSVRDNRDGDDRKADTSFFQPGRAYRSRRCADLRFECQALSADPDTGEQQAIGWRFGPPRKGVRKHRIAALGVDDWMCCDWAAITEGEASHA